MIPWDDIFLLSLFTVGTLASFAVLAYFAERVSKKTRS